LKYDLRWNAGHGKGIAGMDTEQLAEITRFIGRTGFPGSLLTALFQQGCAYFTNATIGPAAIHGIFSLEPIWTMREIEFPEGAMQTEKALAMEDRNLRTKG
jgi:hypothetical protein